jgi:hypothetical protein
MKDAARNMHSDFWTLAQSIADDCREQDEGENCFNLHRFIERLTNRIDELLMEAAGWQQELAGFELDAESIARYLWACLAIKHEGHAYPPRFRGLPILD